MNINTKMLTYILTTSIVIFASSVGYISYNTSKLALNDAEKLASQVAIENAIRIEKELSNDLSSLRTLAQAFTVYKDMPEEEWKSLFLKMYYEVYKHNPQLYKLWDSWELKYYDTTWTHDYGREAFTLSRNNGVISHSLGNRSMDGDGGVYLWIKSNPMDLITEPYWDEVIELNETKKFMSSLSSPIFNNGEYAGIVACDIIMNRFQKIVEEIKPYEKTEAFLCSNQGVIVGHKNEEYIGKNVTEIFSKYEDQFNLSNLINNGENDVYRGINENNEEILLTLAPIEIGDLDAPWSIALIVPIDVVLAEANSTRNWSLLVAFIGLIILSLIIFLISRSISTSLVRTTTILQKLSKGDIEDLETLAINSGDEIESMANSVNSLKDGLLETSIFAENIGKGDLEADFAPLSEKDVLGNSLLNMRKSLKHADEEEEKRKIEDEKQNWATTGIAKFGEILRSNSNNIKDLSFNIMSNLITYLDANQGALFIIDDTNEDEVLLEMKSAIAYERKKFMKKQMRIGEELVGRCAFEKKTIYMTDIPQDYIKITSGMGTANPSALLLVPLILNDEIYGVIEIASFTKFDAYQIEFVERIGESIASTISTVKVNEKTSRLLDQSKQQAEELAAQEEEMRQNMEELQATQEEAQRREQEMNSMISALSSSAFTVEYNMEGVVLSVNEKYCQLLDLASDQIIGKKHSEGYEFTPEMKNRYDDFWRDLRNGISQKEINKLQAAGKEIWLEENYTPIFDNNDDHAYKVLKISFDITEQVLKDAKLKELETQIAEYKNQINNLELTKQEPNKTETKAPKSETEVSDKKPISKMPIEWDESFILGMDEIDQQHEQLVSLANQVYENFKQDKTKKETKESIKSFIDFASYHLGTEEAYFKQYNFDNAAEHIAENKIFIKEMQKFQSDYAANKIKFLDDVMAYIKQWLTNHIKTASQEYVDLFKNAGL